MSITTTQLVELDAADTRVLGRTLATLAREQPKLVRRALGMQVRNVQKSMAATVRNYVIRSKVDGKDVKRKLPPRHPITISLHGKKGGGRLGANTAVSISSSSGSGGTTFEVGYKGGLQRYAERWQDGGKVGLFQDKRANRIRSQLFKADWDALMQDPEFQWRVYRVLGRLFDIHSADELEAARQSGDDNVGAAHAVLRAMVFKRLRENGQTLLENPRTWKGRPFVEFLAEDLQRRFIPSIASIIQKNIEKQVAKK